jgi:hypothetical protein
MTDAILGANFLSEYEATMDFKERVFTTRRSGALSKRSFLLDGTVREGESSERVSSSDPIVKDILTATAMDQDRSRMHTSVQRISVYKPEQVGLLYCPRNVTRVDEESVGWSGEGISALLNDDVFDDKLRVCREMFSEDFVIDDEFMDSDGGPSVSNCDEVELVVKKGDQYIQKSETSFTSKLNDTCAVPNQTLRLKVDEACGVERRTKG